LSPFHYLGGVPHTLTYDNLTLAVRRVLEPVMAGEVKAGEAKELVRLKELIEQAA
jgi:hypothetical protein